MWRVNQFLSIFTFGFMCAALLFTGSLIFVPALAAFAISSAVAVSGWRRPALSTPGGTDA